MNKTCANSINFLLNPIFSWYPYEPSSTCSARDTRNDYGLNIYFKGGYAGHLDVYWYEQWPLCAFIWSRIEKANDPVSMKYADIWTHIEPQRANEQHCLSISSTTFTKRVGFYIRHAGRWCFHEIEINPKPNKKVIKNRFKAISSVKNIVRLALGMWLELAHRSSRADQAYSSRGELDKALCGKREEFADERPSLMKSPGSFHAHRVWNWMQDWWYIIGSIFWASNMSASGAYERMNEVIQYICWTKSS